MNKDRAVFLTLCLALAPLGCQKSDDQIQTYRVSKETSGPSMPMGGGPMMGGGSNSGPMSGGGENQPPSNAAPAAPPMAPMAGKSGANSGSDMQSMGAGMGLKAAGSSNDIQWKVPSDWKVQPPSSMRVGSFLATASNGQKVDISVVPLSGDAGGDLANVNRWRGQINLDPISEADLGKNSKTITAGGLSMLYVSMVSKDLEVDGKYPKRLVAATYKQGSRSWFFKMTGEDKAVQETEPAFLQFLKTLRFNANQ